MKLCVFQGTFNPIHNAHLRVGEFVRTHYDFDKILFIPAYNPPHKVSNKISPIDRFNMVKLAIENIPHFEISDIEYKRKGKSYTYLTIKELYETIHLENKIYFIIGTDAFDKIETWYEIDKLKNLVKFIVFKRDVNFEPTKYNHLIQKGFDFELQTLPFKDISSTQLREKIKNNENITNEIPEKVKEYIINHELYKF
jgi:nicotinate-nucleotide adenylyltransferase